MLPRKERLGKDRDIRSTQKARQYVGRAALLYCIAKDNALPYSRLAVIAPKRIGKATRRNRLKRIVSQAFCKIRHNFARNIDLLVYPKGSELCGPDAFAQAIKNVLGREMFVEK